MYHYKASKMGKVQQTQPEECCALHMLDGHIRLHLPWDESRLVFQLMVKHGDAFSALIYPNTVGFHGKKQLIYSPLNMGQLKAKAEKVYPDSAIHCVNRPRIVHRVFRWKVHANIGI